MKKFVKIISMLFVVAALVSAVGCANKKTATNNETDTTNAQQIYQLRVDLTPPSQLKFQLEN